MNPITFPLIESLGPSSVRLRKPGVRMRSPVKPVRPQVPLPKGQQKSHQQVVVGNPSRHAVTQQIASCQQVGMQLRNRLHRANK